MQQHANHLPSTTGIREQPTSATNHRLASAIVDAPKERGNRFGEARDFGRSVGKGVGGSVEGRKLAPGSHRIMAEAEVELSALAVEVERLRVQGATAIFVAIDGKADGPLAIAVRIKVAAPPAVRACGRQSFASRS